MSAGSGENANSACGGTLSNDLPSLEYTRASTAVRTVAAAPPAPVAADPAPGLRVAVLIPCYNEEVAIPKVVADFRAALPGATIYVYDNNSKDGTAAAARAASAAAHAVVAPGVHGPVDGRGERAHRRGRAAECGRAAVAAASLGRVLR